MIHVSGDASWWQKYVEYYTIQFHNISAFRVTAPLLCLNTDYWACVLPWSPQFFAGAIMRYGTIRLYVFRMTNRPHMCYVLYCTPLRNEGLLKSIANKRIPSCCIYEKFTTSLKKTVEHTLKFRVDIQLTSCVQFFLLSSTVTDITHLQICKFRTVFQ